MSITKGRRAAAKVSDEMAELMDAMVTSSPLIESESALIRHGIRLAMADACERHMISDPQLETRLRQYLEASSIQIGEPLGRG